jgi:hypothetical protein
VRRIYTHTTRWHNASTSRLQNIEELSQHNSKHRQRRFSSTNYPSCNGNNYIYRETKSTNTDNEMSVRNGSSAIDSVHKISDPVTAGGE